MGKVKDEIEGAKGYEVLGTVARVLRCKVSDEDRKAGDDALHSLIEAEKGAKRAKLRIANAAKAVNERIKALEAEQLALHDARQLSEVERTVRCEVRRSETELYLVRLDTGEIVTINRYGWLLDEAGEPIPHPKVDDVMRAIIAHTW